MNPILYILMRNDLPSMNAGKAMAQASHASNAFIHTFRGENPEIEAWKSSTKQGFGTVLVLSVSGNELKKIVSEAREVLMVAGLVNDPTYPRNINIELDTLIPQAEDTAPRVYQGARMTVYRNEITCGYVFGLKEDCQKFVGDLPLYP